MRNTDPEYLDEDGYITMCKTCKCVQSVTNSEIWILDTNLYVKPPDNSRYVVCPKCSEK